MAQVRAHDPERFLISLFAADEDRPALHALYAFNLELARVAGTVSEPILGQVRLQWWREAIEGLYDGTPRQHEVVLALADVMRERTLSREAFESLISGREAELEAEPPATSDDLEAYLRATSAALVVQSLHAVGVPEEDPLLEIGREVGLAGGYATILKALQTAGGRRRPLIPNEVLSRYGIGTADIATGRATPGLAMAVREIVDRAESHLATARRSAVRPARRHMAPLLSAALVPSYLRALKSAGYDPFAANFERGSLARHLRVFSNAVFRRV